MNKFHFQVYNLFLCSNIANTVFKSPFKTDLSMMLHKEGDGFYAVRVKQIFQDL